MERREHNCHGSSGHVFFFYVLANGVPLREGHGYVNEHVGRVTLCTCMEQCVEAFWKD